MKFEHRYTFSKNTEHMDEVMHQMSEDNWELVSAVTREAAGVFDGGTWVFYLWWKKPVPPTPIQLPPA